MENQNKPIYPLRGADGTIFKNDGYADHVDLLSGLTKREHFAGLAMQGLLSNPSQIDTTHFEWIAQHAVGYADALLKELNKS